MNLHISDTRVTASSGLARSTYDRGILFTHNDRSDGPRVFAVRRDGSTRAVLTLEGAKSTDWEDMSNGPNNSARCRIHASSLTRRTTFLTSNWAGPDPGNLTQPWAGHRRNG